MADRRPLVWTPSERSAVWDGKDLAAVQMATFPLPRLFGRPAAEVDANWNLTIYGTPVQVGDLITVTGDGQFMIDAWDEV
jgi:hypothetical protein